jgi:hypothetical protein
MRGMADDRSSEMAASDVRCPWCSAPLPSADEIACPSCGATLTAETEPQVPGVTAIDAEAIVRGVRATGPPRRSRLLSWISGEVPEDEESGPVAHGSLAPPPAEVRREILRMELEAEISDLQAEAGSLLADDEVEAADAGLLPIPPQPEAPPEVAQEAPKPEA